MKKLFYNGTILTLEEPLAAEAVLTEGGLVEAVGEFGALRAAAPRAELCDLRGRTMLPAFLDVHGHFSSYAGGFLQASLEGSLSLEEIAEKIDGFREQNKLAPGSWVVAKGYDHNVLPQKAHPDLAFLDRLAPRNPLVLQHQSGHCGVANSLALEALGLTAQSPDPKGGVLGRQDGRLTGYLEEEAYIQAIKQVPPSDERAMLQAYERAQQDYLARGITTVQEGMMVEQMLPLYEALLQSGLLKLDLVGYAATEAMEALLRAFPKSKGGYDRHFKIGGYKIFLDGSPQVKTAWMRTPYEGEGEACGYGTMSDGAVYEALSRAAGEGVQLLAHCNGDAAAEQLMDAVEKVAEENSAMASLRPVMIHAQLLARDQLPRVARLGIIPSFFVAHVLHWGDIHIQNLGLERAQFISPAQSALDNGIRFTFHQDAPVIAPDMLETVGCAAARRTKTGVLLGESEQISVLEALKAVTVNAAYQNFEEDQKGSIRKGKRADFVILGENPLETEPEKIGRIAVEETILAGETVFKNQLSL